MTLYDVTGSELLPPRISDRTRVAQRVRAPAWPRRTFALTLACVLAVAFVAALAWPLTHAVVPWDSKNQFYPMYRFLGDALRHGSLPLWNPYQYGGYPSVADPQSLLFTPTMFLFALVAPGASMTVFDLVVFAHLVMGGVGVVGLARRWRWHPAAGVLAALVFMFGGAASSRLEHTGMIISYAFFPLALWSLQAALDRRSLRLAALAGAFATLMAIGRDQVAFLLCLALFGAVLRQVFRSDEWRSYLRTRMPALLVTGAVVLALMTVPILLALQFVHTSSRPGIAFGMALAGSLDPVNLLTLVAPNLFGSLDPGKTYWGPGIATVAGNDWTDPTIDYLYAGTLPPVLLVWHGLAGGRLLERGARYFALMLVCALAYALGRNTQIFGVLFDWMPGVSLYRRPADATFIFNIALAFLSGYLLHRFVEEGIPKIDLLHSASGLLAVVTILPTAWLIGAGLTFAQHAQHLDRSLLALLYALAFAAATIAILAGLQKRPRRRIAATILVAATAAQLLVTNVVSVLNAEPSALYAANGDLPPDQAKGLALLKADMAAHSEAGGAARIEVQGVDGPWQNAALIYKLQNIAGYNPLRIAAYERAVGVGESTNDPTLRSFPDTFRGYGSRLAAMLGLRYLILDRPMSALPRFYPRAPATLLFSGQHFFIYRLDGKTLPRVHLVSDLISVDSDDAIDGDVPDFDAATTALVDEADTAKLADPSLLRAETAPPHATAASGTAKILAYADNAIRIDVDADRAGLLVLHDIYYPGWTATIDGRPVPVLRTDLLFRGVGVTAGHHTVEFAFHPFSPANLAAAARTLHKDEE